MSCGTFDYTTHTLLVQALQYNDYYLLLNQTTGQGPAGVTGTLPAMELTFVDNHDTGPLSIAMLDSMKSRPMW